MISPRRTKNPRGSILVVSLMILGASLVMALSASLVAVRQKRLVMSTDDSNYAYQRAENGVERIMARILQAAPEEEINNNIVANCSGGGTICCNEDEGFVQISDDFVARVEFIRKEDEDFFPVDCDSTSYTVSDIVRIKSIGTYRRTQRAIEAPVVWP